jgi:hypothetical protein
MCLIQNREPLTTMRVSSRFFRFATGFHLDTAARALGVQAAS